MKVGQKYYKLSYVKKSLLCFCFLMNQLYQPLVYGLCFYKIEIKENPMVSKLTRALY